MVADTVSTWISLWERILSGYTFLIPQAQNIFTASEDRNALITALAKVPGSENVLLALRGLTSTSSDLAIQRDFYHVCRLLCQ